VSDATADNMDHPRARKVIATLADDRAIDRLPGLVERWRRDRIVWIAVIGTGCVAARAEIDALIRGPGFDRRHYIKTSAHPDESLDDVTEFMLSLVGEYEGDVAIVEV
jgi:hypothetical protein